MKIKIEINTNHPAFRKHAGAELSRRLHSLAATFEDDKTILDMIIFTDNLKNLIPDGDGDLCARVYVEDW